MNGSSTRRRTAGVLAAVVTTVALTTGATTQLANGAAAAPERAVPAGPAQTVAQSPVGIWNGTVVRPDETHTARFTFTAGGRACLDVSGVRSGTGTWTAQGPGRFRYQIREQFVEPDGTVSGYVDIDQRAAQTGPRFSSQGKSRIHDPQGVFLGEVAVTVTASRATTSARGC